MAAMVICATTAVVGPADTMPHPTKKIGSDVGAAGGQRLHTPATKRKGKPKRWTEARPAVPATATSPAIPAVPARPFKRRFNHAKSEIKLAKSGKQPAFWKSRFGKWVRAAVFRANPDLRIAHDMCVPLQSAIETKVATVLRDANLIAKRAGKQGPDDADIRLAVALAHPECAP